MKKVHIRVDENLLAAVDRLAAASKTSCSAIVREALNRWIREKESKLWLRSQNKF